MNSFSDFPNPYSRFASHTSHHCKHPKAKPAYAQPNIQRQSQRATCTHKQTACHIPRQCSGLPLPAALRATRSDSFVYISAPAAPHALCSPSPTSPPFTPVWNVHSPQLRRSLAAVAPLPRSRRAASAPPPCRSRAAIVNFRAACPQTREPWACMAACGYQAGLLTSG